MKMALELHCLQLVRTDQQNIKPGEHEELRFDFGYLDIEETKLVKQHIEEILGKK